MAQAVPKQRIIFLGDSITQAGNRPGGYVAQVRKTLGNKNCEIIGAGVSGNRVPDLRRRLQRDVLDKQPTTVVIYIGINDVWHSQNGRGTPKEAFDSGLREIIGKIKAIGADVYLCTASVIGEKTDGSNPLDGMLEEYCAISRKVAAETDVRLIDLRRAFMDRLKQLNPDQQTKGRLTTDGVHLNARGNTFVAGQVIQALSPRSELVLRHVVLFKFVDGIDGKEVDKIVDAFAALPEKIDSIKDFEHGTNVSQEGKTQGFTHAFTVTFNDQAGIDAYLPHPAHQTFVKLLGGKIEDVLVFDYWTRCEAPKPEVGQSAGGEIPGKELEPIRQLAWLEGSWERESKGRVITEQWKRLSSTTLEGHSVVRNTSTGQEKKSEDLLLTLMGGEVFYLPKVAENSMPIPFRLVASSSTSWTFENSKHDFPQRIEYVQRSQDRLQVTISDLQRDKVLELQFSRVKRR